MTNPETPTDDAPPVFGGDTEFFDDSKTEVTPSKSDGVLLPDIIRFLLGEAPYEGVWYGDKHPTRRGSFWWRTPLRELHTRAPLPQGEEGE